MTAGPLRRRPDFAELFLAGNHSLVEHFGGQREAAAGQLGDTAARLLAGQRAARRHTGREVSDHARGDAVGIE
ncbi:hypothetical protein ACW2Q0_07750 [Nocardia sp. R16R-3T]